MIKRGSIFVLLSILALLALVGCQSSTEAATNTAAVVETGSTILETGAESIAQSDGITDENAAASTTAAIPTSAAAALEAINATLQEPTDPPVDAGGAVAITLNNNSIAVAGDGVTVDGTTATISAAGTYTLSGTLADGQIIVDTEDEAPVQLILNGVDIHSSTSAPIALMNSEAVVIVLADNTANTLSDASAYVFLNPEEEEPSAAIFSNGDLTITGNGSLSVTGNYNDAISSDDSITIQSGNITVTSVDDGIRGKDFLVIQGGTLTVNTGGDSLKSDNEDDAELGYIAIEDGVINVSAGGDAITAQTNVIITGGEFTLVSGGGSGAVIEADASAKGIKGLTNVLIDGGIFTIDTADDAIHSNANITINGGTFIMATGDDGIHADSTVTINGGDIAMTESYEGIESAVITINAGNINVVASDDGVNVAGGTDGSGMMAGSGRGGRGGPGGMQTGEAFNYSGSYYLYIHGGTIVVTAAGDGIDVNGAVEMTNGVVLVNGPTNSGNGALDYDATFHISGGFFVAAGSAGMAQGASSSSTQNSLLINLNGTLPSGMLIHIRDSAGNEILTFAPSKEYQSIAFSSPELVTGNEYTLYYGGSSTGTESDGLYLDGTYAPGTEYTSFTVTSVVTGIGTGGFGR